mgnify:CR=1 FL=1
MKERQLGIFVFSYNRSKFLDNCLQSLWDCASGFSIFLVDDNSDDKETQQVIAKWSEKINRIDPDDKCNKVKDYKVGGLYKNMMRAFVYARDRNIKYALFIQDDMQMVRQIEDFDLYFIDSFFENNPQTCELHTGFLKKSNYQFEEVSSQIEASKTAYFRDEKTCRGTNICTGFSAVGVFQVERFFHFFGRLIDDQQLNEQANERLARSKGIKLGFYAFPFMMWLPMPISSRGKKRSITHKIVEWIGGAGFHPYNYMSSEEVKKFFHRDLDIKPYAENFLQSPSVDHLDVWAFAGGIMTVSVHGGWRKKIGNFINRLSVSRRLARFLR